MIVLALCLAAAAGTTARYGVDTALRRRWPHRPTTPILVVNVSGSALLGLITGLVLFHAAPQEVLTVAGTGFCSSYTTFSTATFETLTLLRGHRFGAAAAHAAGTLGACILAAAGGLLLAASLI